MRDTHVNARLPPVICPGTLPRRNNASVERNVQQQCEILCVVLTDNRIGACCGPMFVPPWTKTILERDTNLRYVCSKSPRFQQRQKLFIRFNRFQSHLAPINFTRFDLVYTQKRSNILEEPISAPARPFNNNFDNLMDFPQSLKLCPQLPKQTPMCLELFGAFGVLGVNSAVKQATTRTRKRH